ncbi:MAG: hypothetical protein RL514_2285 [Verrucomicrobiota bacterium]|jgi:predicted O-methyltransferase YrrM
MSILRQSLQLANRLLGCFNLRLDTLTLVRKEQQRLAEVARHGGFDEAPYFIPPGFLNSSHRFVLDELPKHQARFTSFRRADTNSVGYRFDNGFYSSPDAEVLYAMVRATSPRQILEIGCGNSTKLIRQAIRDGALPCRHLAIDPQPRLEISKLVDEMVFQPIEYANAVPYVQALEAGDILFIDTSHEAVPANDVAYIYGQLLAKIRPGVVVHIHDIFIPYDYPRSWVIDMGLRWGEQYIVQAMLLDEAGWDVLWPGHYLQRTLPAFDAHFPNRAGGMAQSLWLRRCSVGSAAGRSTA